MNLGSGDNGEFTFLDNLAIVSFIIAVINLDENLGQSDKQELQNDLAKKSEAILAEIHQHLEEQDKKLDKILEVLKNDL